MKMLRDNCNFFRETDSSILEEENRSVIDVSGLQAYPCRNFNAVEICSMIYE